MNEEDMAKKAEQPAGRDFGKDPNAQARIRAGRRSTNVLSGKDSEEGLGYTEESIIPETEGYNYGGKVGYAEGGEVTEPEGGIVAEAEKEQEAVAEAIEAETPAEEMAEPGSMEAAEPEAETPMEPEAETPMEPEAETPMGYPDKVGEYAPPEGESHDILVDRYHEALALGDIDQARTLYKQLQEHRFMENTHRAKSDSQAAAEAENYVQVTTDLVAKHPELGEDGLAANKALALADVYRRDGMSAADAISQAVADLYPGSAMAAPAESPAAEMGAEAELGVEPEVEPEAEPDMAAVMGERMDNKRNVVQMPSASSRKEETPPPKEPNRSDAIQLMKEKRGQL